MRQFDPDRFSTLKTVGHREDETSLATQRTMPSASLVMDVEDGEALGESAQTVEELEHFPLNEATELRSASRAAGLG
jgi:hypothetical protein